MSRQDKNPKVPSPTKVDEVMRIVLEAAHNARESAGYSGRYDDGGASRLEDQVKFYNYGRAGTLPPEWKVYTDMVDPEWETYQRLQKKFGQR